MKNKLYNSRIENKFLLILDVFIILGSLIIAFSIRAQFTFFLFEIDSALILFPWVVFLRIIGNLFFEHYSISLKTFTIRDIAKLLKHNIVPTAILLFLRVFSPVSALKVPLSMIFMEYCLTEFGFILIRILIHLRLSKVRDQFVGYVRRILLFGDIADIRNLDYESFVNQNHLTIQGILTPNPLFWEEEVNHIRIFGNEEKIHGLVATDDRISTICIVAPENTTLKRRKYIIQKADDLFLDIGIYNEGQFRIIDKGNRKDILLNREVV